MSTSEPGDLREFWDEERATNEAAWRKGRPGPLQLAMVEAYRRADELGPEIARLAHEHGLHDPPRPCTCPRPDVEQLRERAKKAEAEVERLRATLAKVRELSDRGTGTDLTPTTLGVVDQLWVYEYTGALDKRWRSRLHTLATLDADGGRDE